MVIIETSEWENFEAPTLDLASEKLIECLGQHKETSFTIDAIIINGETLDKKRVDQISRDIEQEIYTWLAIAEIEREGLRRAQQESMEG
jgi:hypothetical protein